VFNIGGEIIVHRLLVYQAERFFNQQAGKGLYNVNDLTEVKLPANLPNIADWTEYENVSGRIQFENTSYNYVKMKITKTAIYLMCVPDYQTTLLLNHNVINAKGLKGVPVPSKNHVPYGKMTLLAQVNCAFTRFAFSSFAKTLSDIPTQPSKKVSNGCADIPEQPPKYSC
jgi:hypothetical protein